jgi:thymidylate synthase
MIEETAKTKEKKKAKKNKKKKKKENNNLNKKKIYKMPKLKKTKKIFKPIVARRPFILVASPGNLAYLKSYGFRTFDSWIDESYDSEPDHYIRIEKITNEIEKLCKLSKTELDAMYADMQDTLEYNHQHFYKEFKRIIVNEMVDNLEGILIQFNNGRQPNNHSRYHRRFEYEPGYTDKVKQLLLE